MAAGVVNEVRLKAHNSHNKYLIFIGVKAAIVLEVLELFFRGHGLFRGHFRGHFHGYARYILVLLVIHVLK